MKSHVLIPVIFSMMVLAGCTTTGLGGGGRISTVDLRAVALPAYFALPPDPYNALGVNGEHMSSPSYTVEWVSDAEARQLCDGKQACSRPNFLAPCVITMSTAIPEVWRDPVERHEKGHCAGWGREPNALGRFQEHPNAVLTVVGG